MELLVKTLAESIKSTEQELRSALSTLGFQIASKKRQNVVSGTVKHALLLDNTEITADKATKELAAIALEFSKTIDEVATFIAEYKAPENGDATDMSEISESASTIEDEIELEELKEETLSAIDTAEQAILQREANENTTFGDLGGLILEADLVMKLQQGRARAWENPNTRKALEGLIKQGSQHKLATLLGKPMTNGVMKLKSLTNILKPTLTVNITSTEVENKLPAVRTAAPSKLLAQASTSTPNSTTTATLPTG
ncbi:MAG: hypothetical protein WBB28_19230 [Crinalium sp.]|uniref:Uncharacterized protein n=1 Tax=Crinalium epipsammum PCC 9333 TaxID=1173022 RepID=K9VVC4_9CYAN|nr:hypothetical protein [Crinalium epipsammum]AFZ11514.1 hypothetical protein Cri9333_0564 [Crinalium epipsammum PCC 9333]